MSLLEHEELNRGVAALSQTLFKHRHAQIVLVGMYDTQLCTTTFRIRLKSGEEFEHETETTMIRDQWKALLGRILHEIDRREMDD